MARYDRLAGRAENFQGDLKWPMPKAVATGSHSQSGTR